MAVRQEYEQYEQLIEIALRELGSAVKVMVRPTFPATEYPRPRIFRFSDNLLWPYVDVAKGEINWNKFHRPDEYYFYSIGGEFVDRRSVIKIINECGCQPAKILRALRRIRAATAWCYARAEGRKRQAEEILRQQASAVEALEAEAAMQALS